MNIVWDRILQVFKPRFALVDAYHPFHTEEIYRPEGISDHEPGSFFFSGTDRVLQIQDDCIGPMDSRVQHPLWHIARNVEPAPAQAIGRRGSRTKALKRREPLRCDPGHGRLDGSFDASPHDKRDCSVIINRQLA